MILQANSTFLPVLGDLQSPEFRPILQTPNISQKASTFSIPNTYDSSSYANGNVKHSGGIKRPNRSQSVPAQLVSHVSNEAARKIQHWWRKMCSVAENSTVDLKAEQVKHSIRHTRTEARVQNLESEVNRLKNALSAERKLRSLQLEAIRSLWSQVQRISTPGSTGTDSGTNKPENIGMGVMNQSMPNGLPNNSPRKKVLQQRDVMSISYAGEVSSEDIGFTQPTGCTSACAKEIENLKETLTSEISQLRQMILKLREPDANFSTSENKIESVETVDSSEERESRQPLAQRPVSLSIAKRNQRRTENPEDLSEVSEAEEIVGFANQISSKLVEDAVEDKDKSETISVSPSGNVNV